ncbi:MAG: hypothetical protein SCALA701_13540 [Candidatus Scalindua sp.]|nr:MAG: hypothetical protein SCALA701_13540 [Candidatus Scalindua sp.]
MMSIAIVVLSNLDVTKAGSIIDPGAGYSEYNDEVDFVGTWTSKMTPLLDGKENLRCSIMIRPDNRFTLVTEDGTTRTGRWQYRCLFSRPFGFAIDCIYDDICEFLTYCVSGFRASSLDGSISLYWSYISSNGSSRSRSSDISEPGEFVTEPPQNVSTSINGGASQTTSPSVKLSVHATDNVLGIGAYYISENSTTPVYNDEGWVNISRRRGCFGPLEYDAEDIPYTFEDISLGDKTLYVWFKDRGNNVSSSESASIELTPDCTVTIDGSALGFSNAFTGDFSVTAPDACSWTATSNDGWITVTSGKSGTGNGIVSFSVTANTHPSTRNGTISIEEETYYITQSGQRGCTYTIIPTNQSFNANVHTLQSVAVANYTGCSWTATSNNSWLTVISGSNSGTGSGTVFYSVAANTSPSTRSGTITIEGKTFYVTQLGQPDCTYTVTPISQTFDSNVNTGSFTVTAIDADACSSNRWTATSNEPNWITIKSGGSGTGDGTVHYSVTANSGRSIRTGTISIEGQTFTVHQSGSCKYRITGSDGMAVSSNAGVYSFGIESTDDCSWTATSNSSWISTDISKTGKWTVAFRVTENSEAIRVGSITAAGLEFTVIQNPVVTGDKNKGKTADDKSSHGEPVNIINGNMYIISTDMSTPGVGIPFNFTRTYNSIDAMDESLGYGWTHNFNISLTVPADNTSDALVSDTDGRLVVFNQTSPDVFEPPNGDYSTLSKTGYSFTWEKKDKMKHTFSSTGQLQSIADRNINTISLTYDDQYRLDTITDTAGRDYSFAYDIDNHIISLSGPAGRTVSYQYDSNGNLLKVTDPVGVVTDYEYNDPNDVHNLTKQTINNKFVFNYTYDAQNRCTNSAGTNGVQGNSFAYNPGNTVITDARGNTIIKHYNSTGKITRIVYPNGSEERFTWDININKIAETNQDGKTWRYEYDSRGNMTKVTDPLSNRKIMTYDGDDNLISITDELGRINGFTYDSNGNVTMITYPDSTTNTFNYNTRGEPLTQTDALGKVTTFSYDTNGNLVSITDPEGNVVMHVYDSLGRRTGMTNARGNVINYQHDALNRVRRVTDALGGQLNSTHEIAGLGSLEDQNNNTTIFQYDALNKLANVNNSMGNSKQLGYDFYSNLNSRTDFEAKTTIYSHDSENRLTNIMYPDKSQVSFTYDAAGRTTKMVDSTGTSTYAYDELGRLTSYISGYRLLLTYTYDVAGNLKTMTYPGNKTVTYSYDMMNRLTLVSDWSGRETNYRYDSRGLLAFMSLPNGTKGQYHYDDAGRLTGLINLKTDDSVIASYTHILDQNGNITSQTSQQPLSVPVQQWTRNYSYGADNRMSLANGIPITYDKNGNQITKGTTTYQYDFENRLKKIVTYGDTWEYTYDSHGTYVGLKKNSRESRFLVDQRGTSNVLVEYDASNKLVAYYIYGLGLIYKIDVSGESFFYHYDFTGNTVAMTDVSENIVNKYAYTPFGSLAGSQEAEANLFRYVGKHGVMDDGSSLLYMRKRHYDPETRRFLSKDPIGFDGGDSNLYAYVQNNPVNFFDPFGLDSTKDYGKTIGHLADLEEKMGYVGMQVEYGLWIGHEHKPFDTLVAKDPDPWNVVSPSGENIDLRWYLQGYLTSNNFQFFLAKLGGGVTYTGWKTLNGKETIDNTKVNFKSLLLGFTNKVRNITFSDLYDEYCNDKR